MSNENVPADIYYSKMLDNFYNMETEQGQGVDFYEKWRDRCAEFPQTNITDEPVAASPVAPESITKNHDAMIILTDDFTAEQKARVVDAHTVREVSKAIAAQVTRPLPNLHLRATMSESSPLVQAHRAAAVGALPVPVVAKSTDEQVHVMPRFAAPAGQHDAADMASINNTIVRAAAKDLFNKSFADPAVTISSQIESKRDAVQAAVLLFQAAMALPVEQSITAGAAKGGIQGQDATAAVEVARQPDEPSAWTVRQINDCADVLDASGEVIATMYGKDARAVVAAHNRFAAPSSQAAPTEQIGAKMPCGAVVTNVYEAYEAGRKSVFAGSQAAPDAKAETDLQREIEADAAAFEATLPCKPARAASTTYPWGWKYTSEATQAAFRAHCTAQSQAAPAATAERFAWPTFESWLASPINPPSSQNEYTRMAFEAGRETLATQAAQKVSAAKHEHVWGDSYYSSAIDGTDRRCECGAYESDAQKGA